MAEHYKGPVALSASKFASPVRKANFAAFPSAVPRPSQSPASNGTVATKAQLAITPSNMAGYNADAQLAMAQNEALKDEVDKHSANFTKAVSSTVTNTRQLLNLVRDSIQKDGPSANSELQTVEDIWNELEHLFEAAKEANAALPKYLEQQKENMSLYHSSMMNEAIHETQEDFNLQNKKVNIQHSLILEHQQVFLDYKAKTESQLHELAELRERVSRLTLDKGLLKTELDNHVQLLAEAQNGSIGEAKRAKDLGEELQKLHISKNDQATEIDSLRNAVNELQEKLHAEKRRISDELEKEIRILKDSVTKEAQAMISLQDVNKTLKAANGEFKKEAEKLKAEIKFLQDKYNNQGGEFSKIFAEHTEQSKKIRNLNGDLQRIERENDDLKSQVQKLEGLKVGHSILEAETSQLQKKLEEQKRQIDGLEKQGRHYTTEIETLMEKTKRLTKENEGLEMENNDLLAKTSEQKMGSGLAALEEENAKLRSDVQNLQKKPGTIDDKALEEMKNQLRVAEEEKAGLVHDIQEWMGLAKRSYEEYKEMLPASKKADQYRQDCLKKDLEISELKRKLEYAALSANQSNGVGPGGDSQYWKVKYETLMARFSH